MGKSHSLCDDTVSPSGPDLVKTWLNNKLSSQLVRKKIVLQEFSIRILDPKVVINEQSMDHAVASTPTADPISPLLARWFIIGIEGARSEKTVSVQIAGKIGEQEFTGGGRENFKGRVTESSISSVIVQALDTAVSDIERLLP